MLMRELILALGGVDGEFIKVIADSVSNSHLSSIRLTIDESRVDRSTSSQVIHMLLIEEKHTLIYN